MPLLPRLLAERWLTSHHADINLSFDGVRFTITTHDAGGRLTIADFDLAERIDVIVDGHAAPWDMTGI